MGKPAAFASLAGVSVVAASTVLMLQSLRVFVSYLVFVVDQSNRGTLAGVATGVFLASGLAWVFIRGAGVRAVVIGSALLLIVSRLALQLWMAPDARLWLGGAAVIFWGWLLFALLVSRREQIALGIGLALALDLGVRIAFRTVDTPWMPNISAHLVTVALVVVLLVGLYYADLPTMMRGAQSIGALSLLAIGPAFALYLLITGNLGLAQARLGLDFPGAAVVLAFGTAVGILFSALRCSGEIAVVTSRRWWLVWRGGLALSVAIGFWWFWNGAHLGSLGLIAGVTASIILFTEVLIGGPVDVVKGSVVWSGLFFTLGLLIEVALLFGYYTFSGSPALLVAVVGMFAVVCLIGTPVELPSSGGRDVPMVMVAGVIGGLLLLISAWEVWSWSDPSVNATIGPDITVMTYNIQSGFSATDHFDLAATAEAIKAAQPDIVVLQEVSRGWLVTSGIDELLWLSDRLNMNYVFGANSDDGLWGNAVLSRAPLGMATTRQYDTTENLKRSVLEVPVNTQVGNLWVLTTHLDDPADAGGIRLRQATELVSSWNGRSPALVAGDFNSDPTDPVITLMRSAGLADFGRVLGPEGFTSHDRRRIDYILGTRDVALRNVSVPNVWSSDHRPVVAQVTIIPERANVPATGIAGTPG